jgi:hypothetical protein
VNELFRMQVSKASNGIRSEWRAAVTVDLQEWIARRKTYNRRRPTKLRVESKTDLAGKFG